MAVTLTTEWQNIAHKTWTPGTGFSVTFWIDAKYSYQTADGNYSIIDTRLTSSVNSGSGSGANYTFELSYANPINDGGTWYFANETILIGNSIVYHNADGTLSLTLNANAIVRGIDMWVGITGDVILPTIPRASSIANQTANIGQTKTISWNRASDNFTHTLKYAFGTSTFNTIGTNLTTSITWTPPTSLYQYIPNAKQGTGQLDLTTFSGSTNIGYKRSTLTLKTVEANCKPIINSITYQDVNSTITNITGDASYIVAGKSTLKINISFSTRLYATLKRITVNGTDYTSSAVAGTTSNGTTPYTLEIPGITKYTGNTINVEVIDTREYPATSTTTISHYINYIALTGNFTAKRVQPTNGQISVNFSGNYFNSSFKSTANTLRIRYRYKRSDASSYSSWTTLTNNTHYKISGNKYFSGTGSSASDLTLSQTFDYRYDYNIQFAINDKITSSTITLTVQKGIPIVNWNKTKFRVNGNLEVEGSLIVNDVEYDVGTKIYETDSPSSSQTLTLTDNIANYKRLKIFAYDSETDTHYSTEIYNNNSSSITFTTMNAVANYGSGAYTVHQTFVNITISGTTLTKGYRTFINVNTNSLSSRTDTGGNYSSGRIELIIGYKN